MKRVFAVVVAMVAVLVMSGAYRANAADVVSGDMSKIFEAASGDTGETRAPQYPFPAQGQGAPYAYPGTPASGPVQQIPSQGQNVPYQTAPGASASLDGMWGANGGQVTLQFQGNQYQMSMGNGTDYGTYQVQGNMIAFQSAAGGVTQFAFIMSPDGVSFQMSPPQNPQVGFVFQRMGSAAPVAVPQQQNPFPGQNTYPAQNPYPSNNPVTPAYPQQPAVSLDGNWGTTENGQPFYISISGGNLSYINANGNVLQTVSFYTQGNMWYETGSDGSQLSTQFQLSPDGRTLSIVLQNGQVRVWTKL